MYFYLNKERLLNGEVTVIFQTESQIPNYKFWGIGRVSRR